MLGVIEEKKKITGWRYLAPVEALRVKDVLMDRVHFFDLRSLKRETCDKESRVYFFSSSAIRRLG